MGRLRLQTSSAMKSRFAGGVWVVQETDCF